MLPHNMVRSDLNRPFDRSLPMTEINKEQQQQQEGQEALNRSPEYTGQKSNI